MKEEPLILEAEPEICLRTSARFSPCRTYRYDLWRRWGDGPYAMFIGLNPSTADETQDDPTIRRCINFAKAWGFSALCMTNLFAFRATDPKDMKEYQQPVGPENNDVLQECAAGAGVIVAAWGVHGVHEDRDKEVLALLPGLQCLGLSKEGHPRHPLYLKGDLKPVPFVVTIEGPKVKREMTAEERVVVPLLATVRYAPATWDKRFAREIQYALKDGLITEGQSGQVWRLFWRYRRQIVCADKERLLEMAERLKTPELREVRS